MFRNIVKKEFPLSHAPKVRHFVIVKADQEGGDQIKFSVKIRQRPESVDSLNNPTNTEQVCDFSKHW